MQDERRTRRKILFRYLGAAVFCLLVSVVYSHFSHGIHSFWMRGLALWPLVLGAVPAFLQARQLFPFGKRQTDRRQSEEGAAQDSDSADPMNDAAVEILKDIYRFGIAAVTAASFLNGVLEIAGTDSFYPDVLFYAGIMMLLFGAAGVLFFLHKNRRG